MSKISLPSGWREKTLESLISFALGGDWGEGEDYDNPDYVAVRCIRASELKMWEEEKGRTAALRKIKKSSLEKRGLLEGDILVEVSGGGPEQPVGRTVLIDKAVLSQHTDAEKVCTNFFRLIRPAPEVFPKYLNYYLHEFYISGRIVAYQAGSNNLRNLKFKEYITISVPLPPFDEQKRIVTKIEELFSELDNGIKSLKTAHEQLKTYRQSLLKHAFEGKLTEQWRKENPSKLESLKHRHHESEVSKEELVSLSPLPTEWEYARLESFILGIEAGKSFKCDEREPSEEEIGVAKVSAVTWGEYDESESKTCTDLSKINEDYFIRKGDFLLSRANTIELVGACVIAKNVTKKIMLSDKTLRVSFSNLLQEYFLYWLRSPKGRDEIMNRSTGNQESMRNIGQNRIKSIIFPLCSAQEAEEIVRIVEQQEIQIQKLDQEITRELVRSETLRRSILKKAFSGQLVPQDLNDDPASELLTRIQTERETTKTQNSKKAREVK